MESEEFTSFERFSYMLCLLEDKQTSSANLLPLNHLLNVSMDVLGLFIKNDYGRNQNKVPYTVLPDWLIYIIIRNLGQNSMSHILILHMFTLHSWRSGREILNTRIRHHVSLSCFHHLSKEVFINTAQILPTQGSGNLYEVNPSHVKPSCFPTTFQFLYYYYFFQEVSSSYTTS